MICRCKTPGESGRDGMSGVNQAADRGETKRGGILMYRKLVSFMVLLNLVSYLGGCTSMRYVSPEETSELGQESSVWVTMTDGTQLEIRDPKVDDSKLVGYVDQQGYKEIDLSEIVSLGVKEPDQGKTMMLAAMVAVGAFVLVWVLSSGSGEDESCST